MVNRWKMSKVDAKFERNGIENHRAQMREMKKKWLQLGTPNRGRRALTRLSVSNDGWHSPLIGRPSSRGWGRPGPCARGPALQGRAPMAVACLALVATGRPPFGAGLRSTKSFFFSFFYGVVFTPLTRLTETIFFSIIRVDSTSSSVSISS